MRASLLSLAIPSLLLACGPDPEPVTPKPVTPIPAASASSSAAVLAPGKPAFENPGGMWMPHQMAAHAKTLKELGLAIDPAELTDPTSKTLSAIVWLGNCSASFVSSEGMLVTNHHCATAALQNNSTPQSNLLKEGYLAKTHADEKSNGPTSRVLVTRAVTDVTRDVLNGTDKITDDRARFLAIEKKQKEIVAACEKDRPGTRCTVASFYEGASYYKVEQLEIRDVRLVWAPPSGVGNFGGEVDNWRWPRHTGDISILRAYVGKDGKPADFSPDNVPYKPTSFLEIASQPLEAGDFVMVAGYPARTNTLRTKPEVDEAVSWSYPRRQKFFEDYLARLAEISRDDKEAEIRATTYTRRFANYLTNTKGQLEGLVKGGLLEERAKQDAELRAFIAADPARRAKFGAVLDDVKKEIEDHQATRESDIELREEFHLPKLMDAARNIVRMAEERAKPDAERDPDFQQRNWPRQLQALDGLETIYLRKVDEAVLGLALERAAAQPEKVRTPALAVVTKDTSKEGIQKAVKALYEGTKLGDKKTRHDLFEKATTAELKNSKDPLVQLALKIRPLLKEVEERNERFAGRMEVLKPRYIEALRAFRGDAHPFAPDANATLRITYGTVRGYKPTADAKLYEPFTTLTQVIGKNQSKAPFDVPAKLVAAVNAKKSAPYVDPKIGDVPVDFLSDLHITGGNSGSATLNAKGELVGLAFDGNYESMASDWQFQPAITRTIHVDIRYIEWLLDAVFDGDHILKEMGVTPKVN